MWTRYQVTALKTGYSTLAFVRDPVDIPQDNDRTLNNGRDVSCAVRVGAIYWGLYKITNPQLSKGNFKEKEKLVTGPSWAPDTRTDWLTDCRS
jgi:hypothetical protein